MNGVLRKHNVGFVSIPEPCGSGVRLGGDFIETGTSAALLMEVPIQSRHSEPQLFGKTIGHFGGGVVERAEIVACLASFSHDKYSIIPSIPTI